MSKIHRGKSASGEPTKSVAYKREIENMRPTLVSVTREDGGTTNVEELVP
jgi:hypothetical protein